MHDEYVRHAKDLDLKHHAGVADPEARPILTRLRRDFGHVLGLSVGAFAETSQELRRLLEEVAVAGAARHWREAGAPSLLAARAAYASTLRRRWGCEAALQGARLRLSRAYLVAGVGDAPAAGRPAAAHAAFDFGSEADLAAATTPVHGGMPAGQRR